jgi:peptidoglycan/LPS O-acetylase OafA/YrhL
MQKKIEVLNSLRAFAALSVCLFHFVCTVVGFIKIEWVLKIFHVGQYGVQTFFVISGFIIPWSMFHAKYKIKFFFTFFLKRIFRLEPPYLISIFIALIIFFMREYYLGKTNNHIVISFKQVALHFGYLIPFFKEYQWLNQVYWTLAVEFQYYFLVALVFIPLVNNSFLIRFLVYVAFIALSFIGTSNFLPYWLPIFLLGILLFLFKTKLITFLEYYSISGILILFCFFKYEMFCTIYILIPIIFILYFDSIKILGLNLVGKISYSIYLIHPLIGCSLINVFSHHIISPILKLLLIFFAFAFTIIISWLTFILVERPSKKFSSSLEYKT